MRPIFVAPLCAGLLMVTACGGEKHVNVTGVLLEGGKPFSPKDSEELTVQFLATKPDVKIQNALADFAGATGTFTLHSPIHDGIPPGEYKIVVSCITTDEHARDRFRDAFTEAKTPLLYTVTDDRSQEIVIDLKLKTVKKK